MYIRQFTKTKHKGTMIGVFTPNFAPLELSGTLNIGLSLCNTESGDVFKRKEGLDRASFRMANTPALSINVKNFEDARKKFYILCRAVQASLESKISAKYLMRLIEMTKNTELEEIAFPEPIKKQKYVKPS